LFTFQGHKKRSTADTKKSAADIKRTGLQRSKSEKDIHVSSHVHKYYAKGRRKEHERAEEEQPAEETHVTERPHAVLQTSNRLAVLLRSFTVKIRVVKLAVNKNQRLRVFTVYIGSVRSQRLMVKILLPLRTVVRSAK
jgi:hypothetical protein